MLLVNDDLNTSGPHHAASERWVASFDDPSIIYRLPAEHHPAKSAAILEHQAQAWYQGFTGQSDSLIAFVVLGVACYLLALKGAQWELEESGGTDIEAGLAKGFELVAAGSDQSLRSDRVMLLTDALPNGGRTGQSSFLELYEAALHAGRRDEDRGRLWHPHLGAGVERGGDGRGHPLSQPQPRRERGSARADSGGDAVERPRLGARMTKRATALSPWWSSPGGIRRAAGRLIDQATRESHLDPHHDSRERSLKAPKSEAWPELCSWSAFCSLSWSITGTGGSPWGDGS